MKRAFLVFFGFILAWSGISAADLGHAQTGNRYLVTVTNNTPGQVITPPVIIIHTGNFSLFEVGSLAGPELAALAENGVTDPLTTLLGDEPEVLDFAVGGGVIFPGESLSVEISSSRKAKITVVGMLAVTNDAFIGLNSIPLPQRRKASFNVPAYDAGSEFNSESCAYIPGCGGGGVHDPATPEGFIHIHSGIHGIADLEPSLYDWRNPAATVTIQRIP